ncbi:MAG: hypothetical protein DWQ36_03685 [Acidobacteria bacterium]|nr:MAG: hypothetical protein DWQ30_06715 [Acidobacteriota bacterium]REK10635.1 MAG: hypothetical protein DWQ36_03685 [Acidobacteriota bacterium]
MGCYLRTLHHRSAVAGYSVAVPSPVVFPGERDHARESFGDQPQVEAILALDAEGVIPVELQSFSVE